MHTGANVELPAFIDAENRLCVRLVDIISLVKILSPNEAHVDLQTYKKRARDHLYRLRNLPDPLVPNHTLVQGSPHPVPVAWSWQHVEDVLVRMSGLSQNSAACVA